MLLRLPILLALTFAACFSFSSSSQAQNRYGVVPLASRSMPRQQVMSRYLPPRVVTRVAARLAPPPSSYSTSTYGTRSSSIAPISVAPPRATVQPIALGTYFWQNGQCAPGNAGAVSQWRNSTGRLPAVWMIYQGWTGWNQFPVEQARRARSMGSQLLVTWEPWSGHQNDSRWSCRRVAAGGYDAYISAYARAVRSAGVPVMLRFAHEMNGDWYPWATAYEGGYGRHNGNSPADYVAMWRRVVKIFRQQGASNARWVWSPNIYYMNASNTMASQSSDLWAMYPGDAWVDWIGLSVYNDGSKRSWNSFSNLFDASYRTITRFTAKPLMIAEIGVTEQGAPWGTSKAQWIEQTFLAEIPYSYPRVKLVNYFCRDKTEFGEANYRFDSSPAALRAFRTVASSPLYQGRVTLQ